MTVQILQGDCRNVLRTLPDCSAQSCVTSPPYYGLRSYLPDGHADKHCEIGTEKTPDDYVAEMVAVFREVKRVLRDDGTLWLNIGDSYASPTKGIGGTNSFQSQNAGSLFAARKVGMGDAKPKDLLGIPWLIAFALRADGWYLRSDIIWAKPNPMPESVCDRPTSAHEHVFLLTKAQRYFYDADAIREPHTRDWWNETPSRPGNPDRKDGGGRQGATETAGSNARAKIDKQRGHVRRHAGFADRWDAMSRAEQMASGSNARNVWTIATRPFSGAHFATMPPDLAERCIKAGTKPGDTVLDPFGGAGTTGLVADRLNRDAVLIELNPDYRTLSADRLRHDAPLLAVVA